MKKTYFSCLVLPLLIVLTLISGCQQQETAGLVTPTYGVDNTEEVDGERVSNIDGITVTCSPDEPVNRYVIRIDNKTDKSLTADLYMYVKYDNKTIAYDVACIEDLKPGTYGWSSLTPEGAFYTNYEFEYYFMDVKWTEKNSAGEIDTALSEKLEEYMYENFGGDGDSQYAASWYDDIEEIEALKIDGGIKVVVTLNDGNKAELICRTLLFARGVDNIIIVEAVDKQGNFLYTVER